MVGEIIHIIVLGFYINRMMLYDTHRIKKRDLPGIFLIIMHSDLKTDNIIYLYVNHSVW